MTTRRQAITHIVGAGMALALPEMVMARPSDTRRIVVHPAKIVRQGEMGRIPFVPKGFGGSLKPHDYVEEEWSVAGVDDGGRPFTTQMVTRRPRDPARFSGTVLVEPLHIHGIAPIFMYSSDYIMRSGHGWACVASQKTALDSHVKPSGDHYAGLSITPGPGLEGLRRDFTKVPLRSATDEEKLKFWMQVRDYNIASDAILAQAAATLRQAGGTFGSAPRKILLIGHSQTGSITTYFVQNAHATHRLAGGAPVFDGYFPSGYPAEAFGPRDVPLIQVVSEADMALPRNDLRPWLSGRPYRRPDSDEPGDRFRLYELAGVGHMGVRYPPFNDPKMWQNDLAGRPDPDRPLNSLPHGELFNMALDHLVKWVGQGTVPPRAERLRLEASGYVTVDEHGNSLGGVRCVQLDVPHSTYHATPTTGDGKPRPGQIGSEVVFSKAHMAALYGTQAKYVETFDRRLDQLIAQGWFLTEDAPGMRAEARAQLF